MPARTAAWLGCVLLAGCGVDAPDDDVNAALGTSIPRVVSAREALETSELPTVDPHTMNDAEVERIMEEERANLPRGTTLALRGGPQHSLRWHRRRAPRGAAGAFPLRYCARRSDPPEILAAAAKKYAPTRPRPGMNPVV